MEKPTTVFRIVTISLELPIMSMSKASILQAPVMKVNNGRELRKLHDVCKQHIMAVQLSDHFNLEMFLTIVMELKMDEVMRLKWMEYSYDSQMTPPYSEFLKFLELGILCQ